MANAKTAKLQLLTIFLYRSILNVRVMIEPVRWKLSVWRFYKSPHNYRIPQHHEHDFLMAYAKGYLSHNWTFFHIFDTGIWFLLKYTTGLW